MNNSLLLFDYNNLLFKGVNVHKTYTFGGRFTGGIYGFVNQLCKNINQFSPSHILVCTDKPPYIRKDLYPDYKSNRIKDEEIYNKIKESRILIDEFLKVTNIPYWTVEGFEADDLFAVACKEYSKVFEDIIIVSNDDDLYQLLEYSNIKIKMNDSIYTLDDFSDEYRITPSDWVRVLAMAGTHNNLKGLKNIGKSTALKLIHNGGFEKVWEDNKELLEFYVSLIKLPFLYPRFDTSIPKADFDLRTAINYLMRLGIDVKSYWLKAFEYLEDTKRR